MLQPYTSFLSPPSILSPVFALLNRHRSAWLYGIYETLPFPCQLWLPRNRVGGEVLTGSDRSRRRPGPVHHLSAHVYRESDSRLSAGYQKGQLPAPSASRFSVTNIFFSTSSEHEGTLFSPGRVETKLFYLSGLFCVWQEQKHSLFAKIRT